MNKSRQDTIPGYLYALDGLRAISLIFIIMFHTWQQSWIFANLQLTPTLKLFDFEIIQRYGYVAIDSFFVLSGFCLFYPIARDMLGESKFGGWKQFYIKRIRRIYPSYLIILAFSLIFPKLSAGHFHPDSVTEYLRFIFSHLFFTQTWDPKVVNVISTSWTMVIEMHFYLIFPLLCIPFKKKPVLTFLAMLLVGQAARLYLICNADLTPHKIQTFPILYLDVFAWGMISAYLVVYIRNKLKSLAALKRNMTAISVICIILAVMYMYWLGDARFPQGYNADVYFRFIYRGIFAALIAIFLLSACFSYDFWQKKIWGNKFFVFLSSVSYTVYLWHQNLYILLKRINVPYSTQNPVMQDRMAMEGQVFICLSASLIIGILVTKYIENPIAKYGFKGSIIQLGETFKRLGKSQQQRRNLH